MAKTQDIAEPKGADAKHAEAPKAHAKRPQMQVTGESSGEFGQVRKSVLFLGAVLIAYIVFLVLSGQMDDFFEAMAGVDASWVVRGALCFVAYCVLGVLGYAVPAARDANIPLGLRDLMSIEAAGVFFSFLSPGGTGAAPAQIYRLTRTGMSVGSASAFQYTRFFLYEFAEGLFAAIMLIFRYQYFFDTIGDFAIIGIILFATKILELVVLLAVCLMPNVVKKIGNWGIGLLRKTPLKADFDRWDEVVNNQVQEFSDGFKSAAKDLPMMGVALLVSMAQLGCLYALPWFVANAFGRSADLLTCLAAGSMLELLTSAIPLPGGTGGAEAGFAMLFRPIFTNVVAPAFIVWRFIEYFGPIIAMVPLLGLRSPGTRTVHDRWKKITRFFSGEKGISAPKGAKSGKALKAGKSSSGGVRIDPRVLLKRRQGKSSE